MVRVADGFRVAKAYVTVEADAEGLREQLKAKVEEAVAGLSARPRVSLDTSELDAKAEEARAVVDELDGSRAEPSIHLNDEGLSAKADEAHAQLDELDARSARPDVSLGTGDLDTRLEEARAQLDEIDARAASARLDLDTAEFDAKLDEAKAKLAEFRSESASAKLGASGGGSGGGHSGGDGEGFGGTLGAASMGIGALLPGVAGAGMGLGLLGGAGALAFGGIGKALSAAHQASLNVGMTPQQRAVTQFGNQVAVQQAQQQVGQAHMQAAQDAITSAASIEQAQMNLASVERNAAESQIQALQSVKQAQQGVEEADYGLSEAQYNLSQAWENAREQIRQLDDQLNDSKLNVQQAQLAIKQALYQQRLTDQNAYSTSLDRQQAALAVAQAQQQLTDAQDQLTASQYKANLANKQGVAGSQLVIQAKQGLVAAQYQQTDAQAQYVNAQRQLTLTELNNAEQVKQAQMQVAMAAEQAAYQRRMDARAVALAELNVTNTVKEQKLQWAATMSTENQAQLQFEKDMSRLSPAARGVVDQILGMRGAFHKLEAATQNAVAPGVSQFLSGLQQAMPAISSGVSQMASVIGGAFGDIGRALSSKQGHDVLKGLISNGVEFAQTVVPAFGQFVGMLGQIGSQKGASSGLANLLAGFARGLTGLAQAVGKNEGPINGFLTAAGNIIAQVGPPLGQLVGLVARALGPLTDYLNRHPNGTVVKILGGIVAGMLAIKGLGKILPDFVTKPLSDAFDKLGTKFLKGPLKNLKSQVVSGLKDAFAPGGLFNKLHFQVTSAIEDATQAFKTGGPKVAAALKGWGGSLASAVKGWSGSVASAVKGVLPTKLDIKLLAQSAKDAGAQVAGQLMSGLSQVKGFFTSTLPQALSTGGQAIKGFASNAVTVVSGWASSVGQAAASAGSSIASFVVSMGSKLAQAATATGAWIAENTVAVASYIAENIAAAASATAAFIAENAASLGLIAGIGLIIAAIVLLATHWKTVWHWIETAALWLWHNVLDPMWHGIEAGASWLYQNAILPLWHGIETAFHGIETVASWLWHNVFDPLWHGIEAGASAFISAFKTSWDTLKTVFATPVNFLIDFVYTKGIEFLWNEVVSHIGLGNLKLPNIPHLAGGGVLAGYAPGHDSVHAVLSPGEGVLVPEAVRAIGPGTVHALNHQYGGGRTSKNNHYSGAGIIGSIWHGITGGLSKAYDIGKIVAAVTTGNSTALSNALDKFIGTKGAAGDYAKMMLGVPTTLVHDAVTALMNALGASSGGSAGLPGNSSGAVGNLPANWNTIASFLAAHGFSRFAAAGVAGNIMAESGGNPEILEIGGGGGGGLIQWTPYPRSYITGNYQQDLMTQLGAILSWGGGPGMVNQAKSPSNAAAIYQDYYERPADLTASLPLRMASANAVYKAMGWGTFDQGGVATGVGMLPKGTPLPERVLSPKQTDLFDRLIHVLERGSGGGYASGGRPVQVEQNFYGSMMPNPEQQAGMRRDLALALSGP